MNFNLKPPFAVLLTSVLKLVLAFVFSIMLGACSDKVDFTDTTGHTGKFSDFQGKWLIINYWATWCKPCLEEIPELNNFSLQHADKVKLFGVDFDNAQGENLIASSQKMGIEFSILTADPSAILFFNRPSALPTTLVFNPDGELHRTLLGPQTEKSLLAAISNNKS